MAKCVWTEPTTNRVNNFRPLHPRFFQKIIFARCAKERHNKIIRQESLFSAKC